MARRNSAIVISTSAIRRAIALLVVFVLLVLAVVFARPYLQRASFGDQIDRASYQAVFLSGGQVFFGRAAANDETLSLSDVFYLAPNTDTSQPQQLGSLVKRGTELHGPREPMLIALRQVIFVENMRDDSQVVQAIKRFKSGEQPVTPTTQPPTPGAPAPTATATARPSASR